MARNFPRPALRLVSGGQTGADRAALDWAIARGIAHGGWCPLGRKAEDGALAACYLLTETPSGGYLQRTRWNVRDSDATLVFTLDGALDGGSRRTAQFAAQLGKPWMHVHPGVQPAAIAHFLRQHGVAVLNVAGKRESAAPGIHNWVRGMLELALR